MNNHLDRIRQLLKSTPTLSAYRAYRNGSQIHLSCHRGHFARLHPAPQSARWRMEFFFNRDRWRCYDFVGTLDECLELLCEAPHYLFWEG